MIIRKTFKSETGHRLIKSYTKRCHGLHGHSYVYEIFISGDTQDDAQMLMDFSLLFEKFNNFMDTFDHSIIVWKEDKSLVEIVPQLNPRYIILPYNTTSEQMSRHIFYQGRRLDLPMYKVIVHETATCCAEFSGDDDISIDLDDVIYSQVIMNEWK